MNANGNGPDGPQLPMPHPASAPGAKRGHRTSKACSRCRRQKLRCDSYRPCALCIRAGIECQPREVADSLSQRAPSILTRQASDASHVSAALPSGAEARYQAATFDSNVAPNHTRSFSFGPAQDVSVSNTQPTEAAGGYPVSKRRRLDSTHDRAHENDSLVPMGRNPQTIHKQVNSIWNQPISGQFVSDTDRVTVSASTDLGDWQKSASEGGRSHKTITSQDGAERSAWGGSSAMDITREMLETHHTERLSPSRTYNLPGGHSRPLHSPKELRGTSSNLFDEDPDEVSRGSVLKLLNALPQKEILDVTLEIYFSNVHWFIWVVDENDFLSHYNDLIRNRAPYSGKDRNPTETIETDTEFSFVLLLYIVVALGAKYASKDPGALTKLSGSEKRPNVALELEKLVKFCVRTLRENFISIIARDNLTAVQTCILLGGLFVYHGEPNLAWSVLGCATKISQTLFMHRNMIKNPPPGYEGLDWTADCQRRKNVWFALRNFDSFAAMVYGRPSGINNADCDVTYPLDLTDPLPVTCNLSQIYNSDKISAESPIRVPKDGSLWELHGFDCQRGPSLFDYQLKKYSMYDLIHEALSTLYGVKGTASFQSTNEDGDGVDFDSMVRIVKDLNQKFNTWYRTVPNTLKLVADRTSLDFGLDEKSWRTLQQQAMAVQLASDSACILINRPLSRYTFAAGKQKDLPQPQYEASAEAATACWTAASRTSKLLQDHRATFMTFRNTHATSFLGIHLLNSGVILAMTAICDLASVRAHEAKRGISRVIKMQEMLKGFSPTAEQGAGLLKDLLRIVLSKEMDRLVGPQPDHFDDQSKGQRVEQHDSTNETHIESTEMIGSGNNGPVYTEFSSGNLPGSIPHNFGNHVGYELFVPDPLMQWEDFSSFEPGNGVSEDSEISQTLFDVEREWYASIVGVPRFF